MRQPLIRLLRGDEIHFLNTQMLLKTASVPAGAVITASTPMAIPGSMEIIPPKIDPATSQPQRIIELHYNPDMLSRTLQVETLLRMDW